MKYLLTLLVVCFGASTQAFAEKDVHEYKLKKLANKSDEIGCQLRVSDFADRFSMASGAKILATGCVSEGTLGRYLTGVVQYEAPEKIKVKSTDEDALLGLELEGTYRSEKSCVEDLPRLVELFETATELQAHAAWCYPFYSTSRELYAYAIHAVGESDVSRQIIGARLDGKICCDPTRVLREVMEDVSQQENVMPVSAVLHNHMLMRNLRLEFYSPKRKRFHLTREIYAEDQNACEAMEDSSTPFLKDVSVSVFCVRDQIGGNPHQLNVLSLTDGYEGPLDYRLVTLQKVFETRFACEQDLQSLLVSLDQTSTNLLGGVCGTSKDKSQFMPHLFYKQDS